MRGSPTLSVTLHKRRKYRFFGQLSIAKTGLIVKVEGGHLMKFKIGVAKNLVAGLKTN